MTTKPKSHLPAGQVLVPAIAIGSLSLVLAIGLRALGILTQLDAAVATWVPSIDGKTFPKSLPDWSLYLVATLFATALPLAMLSVSGTWRRLVLWVTTLVLIASWAPVLCLAARAPEVAMPFIAALWAGVCSLVYASNHRMACDRENKTAATPAALPVHEAR
jgi:hypothetical protein